MKIPKIKNVFIKNDIDNINILHLSDLHINKKTTQKSLIKLVNICNTNEADFIVITGDIIDCKAIKIKEKLDILNAINKKCFYISGNHDLFYGIEELKNILYNLICLDNKYDNLFINNKNIVIAGLSDRFSKFFNIKRKEEEFIKTIKNFDNLIFIAHQPKDYTFALEAKAKLFLCGHTHAGQIYPFHYIVKLFQPFLKGLFYKGKTAIYVNSGLGNWGVGFRYKANSEISLLKLTKKR